MHLLMDIVWIRCGIAQSRACVDVAAIRTAVDVELVVIGLEVDIARVGATLRHAAVDIPVIRRAIHQVGNVPRCLCLCAVIARRSCLGRAAEETPLEPRGAAVHPEAVVNGICRAACRRVPRKASAARHVLTERAGTDGELVAVCLGFWFCDIVRLDRTVARRALVGECPCTCTHPDLVLVRLCGAVGHPFTGRKLLALGVAADEVLCPRGDGQLVLVGARIELPLCLGIRRAAVESRAVRASQGVDGVLVRCGIRDAVRRRRRIPGKAPAARHILVERAVLQENIVPCCGSRQQLRIVRCDMDVTARALVGECTGGADLHTVLIRRARALEDVRAAVLLRALGIAADEAARAAPQTEQVLACQYVKGTLCLSRCMTSHEVRRDVRLGGEVVLRRLCHSAAVLGHCFGTAAVDVLLIGASLHIQLVLVRCRLRSARSRLYLRRAADQIRVEPARMRADPELVLVCRRRREGVCTCALALDRTAAAERAAAPNIIEVAALDGELVLVCRSAQRGRVGCLEFTVAGCTLAIERAGACRGPDLVPVRLYRPERVGSMIYLPRYRTAAVDLLPAGPYVGHILICLQVDVCIQLGEYPASGHKGIL